MGRLLHAGELVLGLGMSLNAGHALNYHNVGAVAAMPGVYQLHIGHSLISRAVFVGLRQAVREMLALIRGGEPGALPSA
jgi:pyridoxine 5-phosphate synthase